jgi:hypothetical protein
MNSKKLFYIVQFTRKSFYRKLSEEWKNAKPFETLPSMTRPQVIKSFIPGGEFMTLTNKITNKQKIISGKYHKLDMIDLHK